MIIDGHRLANPTLFFATPLGPVVGARRSPEGRCTLVTRPPRTRVRTRVRTMVRTHTGTPIRSTVVTASRLPTAVLAERSTAHSCLDDRPRTTMIPATRPPTTMLPTTATGTIGRLVAADRSAIEHKAVHLRKRPLTGVGIGEGDKAKAPRTPRISIEDDGRVRHCAEFLKCCAQGCFVGPPGESTNKQFHAFLISMTRATR